MSKQTEIVPTYDITPLIRRLRDTRVILDTDLAKVYGVPTFRLNEAVKRNRERFPHDFLFQLTQAERDSLTSQIVVPSGPGDPAGAIQPEVLRSQAAILKRGTKVKRQRR